MEEGIGRQRKTPDNDKERIEGRIKCRKEQSDFIYGAVSF